ncbi:MAG: PAS domain S-box protein [Chloroflexi bacterium]|nr:PAS domain S-box protein [Chloroflexota bacterium]
MKRISKPKSPTHKQIQAQLQENVIRYQLLFEHASDGIFIADPHGKYIDVNERACAMLGYTRAELLQLAIRDLVPADEQARDPIRFQELRAGKTVVSERNLKRKDGTLVPVEISATMFPDGRLQGIARDMTERKRAEQALRASEQEYRLLYQRSPIGIFHYDTNLHLTDCNDRFLAIVQSTRERIIGLNILKLRDPNVLPAIRQALEGKEGFYEGFYHATTSDAQIWVSLRIAPILDENDNVRGGVGIVEDVTAQIHHRVKNNLNVVSGLLELQTDLIADAAARAAFAASEQRIRAMALIHAKLYQSSNLARVNIAEYVQDLVDSIRIGNARADTIQVAVQVDDRAFDLNVAIVCGMLINELVTNAFKYAAATEIRVALTHTDQHIGLIVSDNGIGLPPGLDWRHSPSLGLQLAQMFVAQLTGTLELDSTGGTAWRVTFPLPRAD